MTVSSTTARQTYIGDGSLATYPYNFRIFDDADLVLVKRNTVTGVETLLALTTDYTVTGAGGYNGGTFTLLAGVLPSGYDLAAFRELDILQATDLRNQGAYLAEVQERALDRLVMINQQLQDQLNRSIRLPDSEAGGAALKLPGKELRALSALRFDADGNPVIGEAAAATVSPAMQPVVAALSLTLARLAMDPNKGDWLIRATGGTSDRSARDRAADVANVRDFGAIGGGATDNTAAFQAAVDSIPSGGILLIPFEDYAFTGTVELPSNISVIGIGRPTLRLTANPETGIFHADTEDDIDIEGIDFVGMGISHAPGTPERLLYFVDCSRIRVRSCGFASSIYGCHMQTCADLVISGNIVHDIVSHDDLSAGYGFLLSLECDRFAVSGNVFSNISRHAIYISAGSSRGVVDGNVINHCGSIAIDVYATAAQNPCQDIVISNNVVRDIYGAVSPRGIGIAVNVRRIFIIGNLIDTTVQYGIAVEGASGGLEGVDNPRQITICGNEVFSPGINGIWCYSVNDLVLKGNRIVGGATGIIVNGNGASTGDYVRRADIQNNTLQDCTSYGLNISGAGVIDCTLGNNTFRDCATNWNIPSNVPMASWVYQGRTRTLPFHALAIAAGATVNANGPAAGIVYYVGEKALHALALAVRVTGTISAESVTFKLTSNGAPIASLTVTLAAGETYKAVQIPPGTAILAAGTDIGVQVVATAGFLPSGSRNASIALTLGEAT